MLEANTMRLPLLPLQGHPGLSGYDHQPGCRQGTLHQGSGNGHEYDETDLSGDPETGRGERPIASSLYNFGVIAEVKQLLKLPNGAMRILVEGLSRVEVISVVDAVGMNMEAYVAVREDINDHPRKWKP